MTESRALGLTWALELLGRRIGSSKCILFVFFRFRAVSRQLKACRSLNRLIPFRKDKEIRCPRDWNKCIVGGFD